MLIRRLVTLLALLAFSATAAFAAPMSGKVSSINKQVVRVIVTGKIAPWVKKGASVKFLGAKAVLTAVAKDTLTITTPKAAKAKVGAAVTIDKSGATATGC
jgi:hypothetical protein